MGGEVWGQGGLDNEDLSLATLRLKWCAPPL
jgi:hypothetical protein